MPSHDVAERPANGLYGSPLDLVLEFWLAVDLFIEDHPGAGTRSVLCQTFGTIRRRYPAPKIVENRLTERTIRALPDGEHLDGRGLSLKS